MKGGHMAKKKMTKKATKKAGGKKY